MSQTRKGPSPTNDADLEKQFEIEEAEKVRAVAESVYTENDDSVDEQSSSVEASNMNT
jgi:hypothetical protein